MNMNLLTAKAKNLVTIIWSQAPHLPLQLQFNNNHILIKLEKREKKKDRNKGIDNIQTNAR